LRLISPFISCSMRPFLGATPIDWTSVATGDRRQGQNFPSDSGRSLSRVCAFFLALSANVSRTPVHLAIPYIWQENYKPYHLKLITPGSDRSHWMMRQYLIIGERRLRHVGTD
jgi:hypothetical protein